MLPPDYVTILAFTASDEVLTVRQYRPTLEDYSLELPSGHVEPGENAAEAAIRELHEETGYRAGTVELLGVLAPDTGRLGNRLWCYLAPEVQLDGSGEWEREPGIEVLRHPKSKLLEFVDGGRFRHAYDLAVLALALTKKKY